MSKKIDWDLLKESLEPIRNKTIWVTMPSHPPSQIMYGTTRGIEPIRRDYDEEERIKKEKSILDFKSALENKIPSKSDINEVKKKKI